VCRPEVVQIAAQEEPLTDNAAVLHGVMTVLLKLRRRESG
jgi:hypothetical protein